MEPHEYFAELKTNLKDAQKAEFESQMATIKEQILAASEIGQKTFLHRLSFTHEVIKKEQELLAYGISKYMLRDDITKFLDKVVPKNSIKIIELDRYPRPIPLDVMTKIKEVKELGIFDDFFIVFTDFTDNTYETPEEKKMVERNRDPVVFGWFKLDKPNFKHDRVYYVADWIDEYCDLDFAQLVKKMSESGFKAPGEIKPGKITIDDSKISDIVKNSYNDMNKPSQFEPRNRNNSFMGTVKRWINSI